MKNGIIIINVNNHANYNIIIFLNIGKLVVCKISNHPNCQFKHKMQRAMTILTHAYFQPIVLSVIEVVVMKPYWWEPSIGFAYQ